MTAPSLSSAAPARRYRYSPDPELDTALRYAEATARRMSREHTDSAFDNDDLLSEAYLAAIQAHRKWRPDGGASRKTLIITRVRFAIREFYRQTDWLSRHYRDIEQARVRAIEDAQDSDERRRLEAERPPWSLGPVSLELFLDEDGEPMDADVLSALQIVADDEQRMLRLDLARLLARIPKRLREILALYHWGELTHREIGRRLGISATRSRQLLGDAYSILRSLLPDDYLGTPFASDPSPDPVPRFYAISDEEFLTEYQALGENKAAMARRYSVLWGKIDRRVARCRRGTKKAAVP